MSATTAKQLDGKVAIVTGGSRGIGFAIARALGAEGARVAIGARTVREVDEARGKLEAEGVETLARPLDVTREGDVSAFVADVLARWGRVDVLVNNAGVYGAVGPLDDCDYAQWKQAFDVNVFGLVLLCRAVLPTMRAQRSGKIINLAGAGVGGPGVPPRLSAYASSKAAIVQLTESLGRDLASSNIQVNAVSPGAVATEITAAFVAAGPEKAGKELYESALKQQKGGGESPDLAAHLVVWLASEASGALTGKLLSAKWDKVATLDVAAANGSSLYTLRRVDDVMFKEVPKK